jgi:bifunctional non-homologous end joining protein LigD
MADCGAGHEGEPRFVVQRHEASTTHYDLRLEASGVLKSWSVPKGPSADPRSKRLAVPTEDHPLEYASFEGEIPEGEYGAGTVTIWDSGSYENLTTDRSANEVAAPEAIERGHIKVRMHGEKLNGGYSLTRMGGGGQERWLLVKTADKTGADGR